MPSLISVREKTGSLFGFRFCVKLFGLRDPTLDAARQADLFADFMGGRRLEIHKLPIMENAKIVELLLDCGRDADKFLQIVGDAARARQGLKTIGLGRRQLLNDRLRRSAGIDAALTLRT